MMTSSFKVTEMATKSRAHIYTAANVVSAATAVINGIHATDFANVRR